MMRRSANWRLRALIAAVVLIAVACGSDEGNANYAEIPAVGNEPASPSAAEGDSDQPNPAAPVDVPAAGNNVEVTGVDADLAVAVQAQLDERPAGELVSDPFRFDEVVGDYDRFLETRSQVVLGESDLANLAGLATDAGSAQVAALRAEQETKVANEAVSALTALFEWSNVSAMSVEGDRYRFFDCTERQERNSYGGSRLYFVTNEVTMVATGDGYIVDDIVVRQPGFWAEQPGELACVPDSLAERAQDVAAQALAEVADIVADPAAAQDRGISPVVGGELRDLLDDGIDALVESNRYRPADEVVDLEVLGIDANTPDLVVVVGVCRTYPNGRTFLDATTDQALGQDLAPGATEYERLYIRLQHGLDGEPDAAVRAEPLGPTC